MVGYCDHSVSPGSNQRLVHQAPAVDTQRFVLPTVVGFGCSPKPTQAEQAQQGNSHTSSISRLPGWLRLNIEGSLLYVWAASRSAAARFVQTSRSGNDRAAVRLAWSAGSSELASCEALQPAYQAFCATSQSTGTRSSKLGSAEQLTHTAKVETGFPGYFPGSGLRSPGTALAFRLATARKGRLTRCGSDKRNSKGLSQRCLT